MLQFVFNSREFLGNVSRSFTSSKQRLPATKKMRQDTLRGWLNFSDFYNGVSVIPELYWTEDMLLFFKLMLVLQVVEVLY